MNLHYIYFVKIDRFLDFSSDFNSEKLQRHNSDALKYHGIEKFEIRNRVPDFQFSKKLENAQILGESSGWGNPADIKDPAGIQP